MCVMSMVYDDFNKRIPDNWQPTIAPLPTYIPGTVTVTTWPLAESPDVVALRAEVSALRQLVAEFKEATEAAAKVDRLTRQPDCVDPSKRSLDDRVTELEKRLDAVSRAFGTAT